MKGILTQKQIFNTIISKPVPDMQPDDYETLEKHSKDMSNAFRLYLEEIKKNPKHIITRNCLSDLLACPPSELLYERLPVFFRDTEYKYTNAFLSGN